MNVIYEGPEVGPIRPPSEAESMMLRVTRNCPWNKCRFCGLYKGEKFSIRRREHVLADIDARAAEGWLPRSVFLQDANTLLTKTDDLEAILLRLRERFPTLRRVTSYARSKTVVAKGATDLARLRAAGLDRIHIGMESGSDAVLDFMEKGATQAVHIEAGLLVKGADIELSEYFLLGLGGRDLSDENADGTAEALNAINPDFVRIRTLSVGKHTPLFEDVKEGRFTPIGDIEKAKELLRMLKALDITGRVIANDHIANLLPDATGKYPCDKEKIVDAVSRFVNMPKYEQTVYRIGRRSGLIGSIADLENRQLVDYIKRIMEEYGINEDNADEFVERALRRFI